MVSGKLGQVAMPPKLTIVIPVYNERQTLPRVLEAVKKLPVEKQIIVVDNFSTDGTREFLESLDDPEIEVILNPRNLGKGTSVRKGMARAKGRFVAVQDADLEYDPKNLLELLRKAEGEGYEAVFGSRLLGLKKGLWKYRARSQVERLEQMSYALARLFFSLLTRLLFGRAITDPATCHKLLRTDLARSLDLKSSGFDLDFEISAKIAKKKAKFCEVPIPYRPRTLKEGKKIRPRDALFGARAMLKVWLGRL